jgi:glucosylceramidase
MIIDLLSSAMLYGNGNMRNRQINRFNSDGGDMETWVTLPDQSAVFAKQSSYLPVAAPEQGQPTIEVNASRRYQNMDGFGFSLTGGSADVINGLDSAKRENLLRQLFSTLCDGIGISCLRISIGASDLSARAYSYDEMPQGQTDLGLEKFNLKAGDTETIPLLKEILEINPELKIIATPWSAPKWMKTKYDFKGGSLRYEYYDVYARYIVTFIRRMQECGIGVSAITPQNEPLHGGNEPSMWMSAAQQADFIKNNLGPALRDADLEDVAIFCYDHNCDRVDYPLRVLADVGARQFIKGVAWHLYDDKREIESLSKVSEKYDIKTYFTEQALTTQGSFGENLIWHVENVLVGAIRNGAEAVLEWNLAARPDQGPHTAGGCSVCVGALTIDAGAIKRNASYYAIAHLSRFVRPGSVRIFSSANDALPNVAFETPDGQIVLLVLNCGLGVQHFSVRINQQAFAAVLQGGAVATYVWQSDWASAV